LPAPVADGVVEATEKNLIPVEKRSPGASFTLPANPLSDLDAGDLASFIECTLFEASGDAAPAKSEAKLPTVPETQAPAAAPEPSMAPTPLPVMPPAPATLKSRLMHAAPYALCTIVGVLVGAAIRGPAHAPPPPPVVAPPAPKPAVAAPAATLPAPAPAVAPPAPTPAPRPTAAPVAPAPAPKPHAAVSGPADCVTNVMTTPDGATVTWGTRPLGVTPVRNAHVPCGESLVALSHERYREVTLNVTTERGQVAVVSERLQRPMGTLTLSSSPGRATFTMNGQVVGAGPRNIKVMRFEHIRVVAKLDGYQPWVKTVYLKEPELKVVAQLVPFPKSFHHWR
jgi:hypothetical protein